MKTKVLFLINSLGGGGAERVLVNLVNRMNQTKYDITVLTMFDDGVNKDFLAPHIHYESRHFPCPPGTSILFRFMTDKLLYKIFVGNEHYDVLIAYMHGAPTKVISGCTEKKVKKIAWLHTGNSKEGSVFKFWHTKDQAFEAYRSYSAIVGVADSVIEDFKRYTGIEERLFTVYNTNDYSKIVEMAKANVDRLCRQQDTIHLCAIGRLAKEKRFDRLIEAAQRLHEEGYNIEAWILGKGTLEEKLKEQIKEYKAEEYVHLLGFQKNPYAIMKQTDIYVLSSETEGLATVLTESLVLGLPIIATDVSGTREVLGDHDEYGIVVENSEEGVYQGIKKMLDHPELVEHYKKKSLERAQFFMPEKTVKQAEKLIDDVIGGNV